MCLQESLPSESPVTDGALVSLLPAVLEADVGGEVGPLGEAGGALRAGVRSLVCYALKCIVNLSLVFISLFNVSCKYVNADHFFLFILITGVRSFIC